MVGKFYLHDYGDGKFVTGQVFEQLTEEYYLLSVDDVTKSGVVVPHEVHGLREFAEAAQEYHVGWQFFDTREALNAWIDHVDEDKDTTLKVVPIT